MPPLPQPAEYFNSSRWDRWVWRYDENFQISDYTFSNLDLTTMANVGAGDPRVWVHIVSAWVISWFAWRVRILAKATKSTLFVPVASVHA